MNMKPSASFQVLAPMDEYSKEKLWKIVDTLEKERDPRNDGLIRMLDQLVYDQSKFVFPKLELPARDSPRRPK